jgi:hypothetical protein
MLEIYFLDIYIRIAHNFFSSQNDEHSYSYLAS